MTASTYVTSRPLRFGHSVAQSEGIVWMKAALERAVEAAPLSDARNALRFYDRLARASAIESRTTCLTDYTHMNWERMKVFVAPLMGDGQPAHHPSLWNRPTLEARMEAFAETAFELARDAFHSDQRAPDYLMQVSCTGYDSPTAVQRVAVERGWLNSRIHHLGHMGCYAALPAVALASEVVLAGKGQRSAAMSGETPGASIFLVELCTLHHDPAALDVEQIVQQSLFADGAARVDVSCVPSTGCFELLDHAEVLIPATLEEMTWRVADSAFRMTLSRRIPEHIAANLASAVDSFLQRNDLAVADVPWWAVHPGGPRVIESTAEALSLPDVAVAHSRAVYRTRGNMSSTTIPHIWAAMAADKDVRAGDLVCSVAFGPGLTIAMNLMRAG